MRIERISEYGRFAELKDEWDSLRSGPGSHSPALTHQWFSAWLQAFGRGVELAILALYENDPNAAGVERLIGSAPMQIVRSTYRGIRSGQLRFLYNRHGPRCSILLRDGYGEYARLLLEEILKLQGWDIAILENVPHDSYLYQLC